MHLVQVYVYIWFVSVGEHVFSLLFIAGRFPRAPIVGVYVCAPVLWNSSRSVVDISDDTKAMMLAAAAQRDFPTLSDR